MAIIRQNSVSGINSITAQSNALDFYDNTGNKLAIGADVTGNLTGNVTGNADTATTALGISTSQINVGETFLKPTAIGIGSTTIAGRNAGVGTASGTLSYAADTGLFLYIESKGWIKVAPLITATGGTKTEDGSRKVHTFTSPGSFIIDGDVTANILVVAGGGSGGRGDWTSSSSSEGTGGGGAGGLRYRSSISMSPGTYSIEVGTGGPGGTNGGLFSNGGSSFISGISSATGGGIGAWAPAAAEPANPDAGGSLYWGRKGGCGGGAANSATGGDALVSPDGISPTAQGFAGGSSNATGTGGGGGGAGGAGGDNYTVANTGGGAGLPYSISGSNYTYAAGGNIDTNGVDGVNYGDGGGSSPFGSTNAGGGADGIVIISWVE